MLLGAKEGWETIVQAKEQKHIINLMDFQIVVLSNSITFN
jgi:hypothetical protein